MDLHANKRVRLTPQLDSQALPAVQDNTASSEQPQSLQPVATSPHIPAGQIMPEQQTLSHAELHQKREEVRSQMKQFMNHLATMAKNGTITIDKARSTADKVKAEAIKKLAMLDQLDPQNQHGFSSQPPPLVPSLDTQQPPLVPQSVPSTSNMAPMHQRQESVKTQLSVHATPPNNTLTLSPAQKPSASLPVWSGAVKWSFVDPATKAKRDLAFFVDAIPPRNNAAAELYVQLNAVIEAPSLNSIC